MKPKEPILSVRDLTLTLDETGQHRVVVDALSLDIHKGQTVAIVGESGAGKSLTALAIMRLMPEPPAQIDSGRILFEGRDLVTLPEKEMQKVRGNRIAMIFQEPVTALNPVKPVGPQIGEGVRWHQRLDKRNTREQVLALMEMVGIPDPRRRYRSYPHQLSGGIRQRVMIAMALACRPQLLLADEPTSALDTTVQAQIVDLLSRLIRDLDMSVLLISHDLGVVAALADRVVVVHDGRVIEEGGVREILKDPLHPYTQALIDARPLKRDSFPGTAFASGGAVTTRAQNAVDKCPFGALCPMASDVCRKDPPLLTDVDTGRKVRCSMRESAHE